MRTAGAATIFILFIVVAMAIYYAPLSQKTLTLTSTASSQVVNTETRYTTEYSTSKIQEVSTFTIQTVTESDTTVLDKGYRAWAAGNEFGYLPIKGLTIDDRVDMEVNYPYKIWVRLTVPDGKNVLDEYFDGGDFKKSTTVNLEGTYTLWIDTLFSPGIDILRVKVVVAHPQPTFYVTQSSLEEEKVYQQTRMSIVEATQITTLESYLTTYTETTLQSRNILTPTLIGIGLIIMILGMIAGRKRSPARIVYCASCGSPLSLGEKFCGKCGAQKQQ